MKKKEIYYSVEKKSDYIKGLREAYYSDEKKLDYNKGLRIPNFFFFQFDRLTANDLESMQYK